MSSSTGIANCALASWAISFLTVICTSMPPRPRRRSRLDCPFTMSSPFGISREPQAPFSTIWSLLRSARSMPSATAATTARVTSCAGARHSTGCEPRTPGHVIVKVNPRLLQATLARTRASPRELNRLDTKNWSPMPSDLERDIADRVGKLAPKVDVLLLLDQVEIPETGVATRVVCEAVHAAMRKKRWPDGPRR